MRRTIVIRSVCRHSIILVDNQNLEWKKKNTVRHVGYLWKALTASAWLGSFAIQESLPRHSWMLHSCGKLSGSVKNMYTTPNNFEACVAIKWDWKYKTPEVCILLSLFYFRMSPQRTFPKPNVTFWKTFKKNFFCLTAVVSWDRVWL